MRAFIYYSCVVIVCLYFGQLSQAEEPAKGLFAYYDFEDADQTGLDGTGNGYDLAASDPLEGLVHQHDDSQHEEPDAYDGYYPFTNGRLIEKSGIGRHEVIISENQEFNYLHMESVEPVPVGDNTAIAYYRFPISLDAGDAAKATGISFEVRGDSSDTLVSVFLSNGQFNLESGWEASFPAGPDGWRKVSLSWNDFVLNYKPWRPSVGVSVSQYKPVAGNITWMAFGRGNHYHDDYPEAWLFDIRKLRLEFDQKPQPVPSQYPSRLGKLKSLLKSGQDFNVLLLGDSLTATNKVNSWGHRFANHLAQAYGVNVTIHNAAIPGHTTRGGYIVLERSLAGMPKPDLVCMLYGANDAKGIEISSGSEPMTADDMQFHYEDLIDRVRVMTNGNADLLMMTGNPRYTESGGPVSANIIEQVMEGIIAAADSRDVFLVDTFSDYLGLSEAEIATYLKDTVHPSDEGIDYLASLALAAAVDNIENGGGTRNSILE